MAKSNAERGKLSVSGCTRHSILSGKPSLSRGFSGSVAGSIMYKDNLPGPGLTGPENWRKLTYISNAYKCGRKRGSGAFLPYPQPACNAGRHALKGAQQHFSVWAVIYEL
jgi:hypothetical protein